MNVLFAGPESAWGGIFDAIRSGLPGRNLEFTDRFSIAGLKGFDVVIPATSPVTEELLESGDRLRLIQQCGSGLDSVDIDAARRRGIYVAHVPTWISGSADAIAEAGILMMIGVSRNMRELGRSLAARKMGEPRGRAVHGSTVGIVGLGGIGRALVKRLRGFDVRLIGIKRHRQRECMKELGMDWVGKPEELNRMLAKSDYVFLCVPLSAETRNMINRASISAMKQGSFLINLARGGLVDRLALEEALGSGKIAGAGLDVFWEEPPDPDDPIFSHNVIATPHAASVTDAAVRGVAAIVVENIKRVEKKMKPRFCVF